ncbi:hypothetical protein [Micromonospora chokoriensis]|uniref:Uncharacterized protein n=1 Tax=Micromonospora chokoriensis TaxID=356851 RepID=A0A1C4WNZ9_9ACTN|nr:hypothetical protein [Micromonospora chokoriensis]SCE97888.1 hypothetical protein GA0070612_2668 [Micromonospora chokoriensis]
MSDPRQRSGLRAPFWESMVGMLTAIAGLVTAIVGVAAFVYQVGGFGAANGPQGAAAPSAAPSSAGPAVAPTTPTHVDSVQSTAVGPYELLFNNNGVDLDADPATVATGPDPSIDIYDGGNSIRSYPAWSGLARWDRSGAPQRQDCLSLLGSFATTDSRYIKGSRYCVRTRGDLHVAFVEFVEPISGGWKIRVTVWPGTAS